MAGVLRLRGRTNYAYAVARVKAKQAALVPPSEYGKILKMDVAEIVRYVEDSAYKTEVDELATRFSGLDLLEAALTVSEERTFQAVRRMVDGDGGALVHLFLDRFLVSNLKTILRGKRAGASREELLKELLLEDLDTFAVFQPLLADEVKGTDDAIAALEKQEGIGRTWAAVLRSVPEDAGPQALEDALDRAYYARLLAYLKTANERGAEQMRAFIRREIDSINLTNAVRWAHASQEGDFSGYVIPGGQELSIADAVNVSRQRDLTAVAETLKDHRFLEQIRDGLQTSAESGRLIHFQTAVARALMADLDRLAHIHPLSIAPILLFLVRKHREVVTLRTIARGKAAGLSEGRLKELIP